jgi:hypothetical protein
MKRFLIINFIKIKLKIREITKKYQNIDIQSSNI